MNYPFTAIVGQEKLKKALLLCAINPAIGGLLIQGDKGTAKSTAARALSAVVPQISKVSACLFNCATARPLAVCEVCNQAETVVVKQPAPFVNLPLGATEERIIGSLDLNSILVHKQKKFQPGLLASVHQGILYIDEVNLLSDHLVDVLLDVAAMGENRVEREGLSISHPSRFTLIGTMNPEEGQLRPQFLDRFALMVHVDAPGNAAERTEVVRRRIAFEKDRQAFNLQWAAAELQLQERLIAARDLLPSVQLSDDLLNFITQLCLSVHVKSLRADIVIYKTAITIAALDLRSQVTEQDIREAAELALAHRSKNKTLPSQSQIQPQVQQPQSNQASENEPSQSEVKQPQVQPQAMPPKTPSSAEQQQLDQQQQESQQQEQQQQELQQNKQEQSAENQGAEEGSNNQQLSPDEVFNAVSTPLPQLNDLVQRNTDSPHTGKRSLSNHTNRGNYIKSMPTNQVTDLAVDATVMQALIRNPEELQITREDLRQKVRIGKSSNLILFVVDASGSMAARKRMEAVKGTVLTLLAEAYEKRDTVGVITFRGLEAQIMLQPTQSIELAEEAMKSLPTGGRTPLPHALQLSIALLNNQNINSAAHRPILVMLTDGKANVSLPGTAEDPWQQTVLYSNELKSLNVQCVVINSGNDYFNLGKAEELALLSGAQYLSLDDLSDAQLTPIISQISAHG